MLGSARAAIFNAVGGFALVDFVVGSLSVETPHPPVNEPTSSWWPFHSGPRHNVCYPEETVREDFSQWIREHRQLALPATSILLASGGIWACVGGTAAFLSDTEEGVDIYIRLKEIFE